LPPDPGTCSSPRPTSPSRKTCFAGVYVGFEQLVAVCFEFRQTLGQPSGDAAAKRLERIHRPGDDRTDAFGRVTDRSGLAPRRTRHVVDARIDRVPERLMADESVHAH